MPKILAGSSHLLPFPFSCIGLGSTYTTQPDPLCSWLFLGFFFYHFPLHSFPLLSQRFFFQRRLIFGPGVKSLVLAMSSSNSGATFCIVRVARAGSRSSLS